MCTLFKNMFYCNNCNSRKNLIKYVTTYLKNQIATSLRTVKNINFTRDALLKKLDKYRKQHLRKCKQTVKTRVKVQRWLLKFFSDVLFIEKVSRVCEVWGASASCHAGWRRRGSACTERRSGEAAGRAPVAGGAAAGRRETLRALAPDLFRQPPAPPLQRTVQRRCTSALINNTTIAVRRPHALLHLVTVISNNFDGCDNGSLNNKLILCFRLL